MSSDLIIKNQFGEQSQNEILGGDAVLTLPIGAGTILANLTGGSAVPTGTAKQTVSNALPAKAGVTAISALGTVTVVDNTKASIDTALATIVAAQNAILAALKVVS